MRGERERNGGAVLMTQNVISKYRSGKINITMAEKIMSGFPEIY
jgi:hypothetical protein